MSGARDEILARIRRANDTARSQPVPAEDARRAAGVIEGGPRATPPSPAHPSREALLDRFAEVTADYRAVVVRCPAAQIGAQVRDALAAHGARSVVVPAELDRDWLAGYDGDVLAEGPIGGDTGQEGDVVDEPAPGARALSAAELDRIDAVVTGARVGIADTGTIVLDHTGDQGRRAISLVPDVHVCVIREDQVVGSVPEAVVALRDSVDRRLPLTWISGPSATSDIELNRIEGVHGPRHLHVVIAG